MVNAINTIPKCVNNVVYANEINGENIENHTNLPTSRLMQLSFCAVVILRLDGCGCFRPIAVQFGLNVASSIAIVESKLLHVNRNSEF